MKKEYAEWLLEKTKQDYNKIAQEFSNTRSFMWKDLEFLIKYSTAGDRVLDLGCGNGRLYQALENKNVDYIGVDNSDKLIEIAKKKYLYPVKSAQGGARQFNRARAKFQVADGLGLPFPNNSFDKIYCIAVLHHIPSKELRLRFLQEAKRVLKPNGLLILTVWKLAQVFSIKLILKFTFLKLFGQSKLDFGDVFVPWANKCQRYVHNFSENGLQKLLRQARFQIEKIGTLWRPEKKNANIYAIIKKALPTTN